MTISRSFSRRLLPIALAMAAPATSHAQLRVSRLVGDHMVMQRGVAVPVWGWAPPGDAITVTFDGRRHATRADAKGAWQVTLPAMKAGGPHEMTVADRGERIAVRDILVGDVWICSGQSNMEFVVADARNGASEVAAAHDPMIRHFKVPNSYATRPEDELAGGSWEVADSAHAGHVTAVGYFFARDVRKHVNVPIGLLHTSWGGTRIEEWMSAEALHLGPGAVDSMMRQEREREAHALDSVRARLGGTLPTRDAGLVDGRAVWADPTLSDTAWATIAVPADWETQGYDALDGIAWYRTSFELSDAEARAGVTLGLGEIDDSDISYVNGHEVGRMTNAWDKPRRYTVPASALRAGRNVITVRVEDTGGGGGIVGVPAELYVESGGVKRPLAGAWKFKVGLVSAGTNAQQINTVPTLLYNKMVHPLLRYPIKGALWYQGEANADHYADAVAYRPLFAGMIEDWRRRWHVGAFPFLFVQLANYMAADSEPVLESNWAALRESQSAALRLPNTAQAVIIDIGEGGDIHPKNKQDVGARLALAARKVAYGEKSVVYSGPTFRRQRVRGDRVIVHFDHVGGGLTTRGGSPPGGFAIAGADRHFVWANASIEGDSVVVWSDRVKNPVAVRYAWDNNPTRANLYNREGLPAAPFRTDAW